MIRRRAADAGTRVLPYELQLVDWRQGVAHHRPIRLARQERERIAFASHRRAHRRLPLRRARALRRVADERRVVSGDEGGRVYRRARASLVASFAAGVPL
jgi:hypothetical protein